MAPFFIAANSQIGENIGRSLLHHDQLPGPQNAGIIGNGK
jgi:hypothetical protein